MTNSGGHDDSQHGPVWPSWAWEDPTLVSTQKIDAVPKLPERQHSGRKPWVQSTLEAAPISRLSFLATAFVIGAILGIAGGYFVVSSVKSASPVATSTTPIASSYIITGMGNQSIVAVRSDTGQSVLITTTSKTSFQRAGLPDTRDDLSIGLQITVTGQRITSTHIDADSIQVQDTRLSGQIQGIDDTDDTDATVLTIANGGSQFTISLTVSTRVVDSLTHQLLDRTALHVGLQIRAYGSISPNGSLAAAIIMIQQ
ncbi:MAG TPA: hypothetical protein VFX24_00790 [Ktedonobacterales bacterium]|jgi:hypothetical protein|nr:hypothetical protein [Ktedonobacterales bacterium]